MTARGGWLLVPALLACALGTAGGAALTLRMSLHAPGTGAGLYEPGSWSLANWMALADAHHGRIIATTVVTGLAVAALSTSAGYLMALAAAPLSGWRFALAIGLILAPRLCGVLAALFGLQRLLPRGWLGGVLAETWLVAPYAALVLVVALRGIDPALAAAARGLGAGPWLVLARVVWPLSLPAVALCLQLGWVWGLGAFLGPMFLGGPGEATLAVEMQRELFDLGRWPRAAADGVALSLLCVVALAASPRGARA